MYISPYIYICIYKCLHTHTNACAWEWLQLTGLAAMRDAAVFSPLYACRAGLPSCFCCTKPKLPIAGSLSAGVCQTTAPGCLTALLERQAGWSVLFVVSVRCSAVAGAELRCLRQPAPAHFPDSGSGTVWRSAQSPKACTGVGVIFLPFTGLRRRTAT